MCIYVYMCVYIHMYIYVYVCIYMYVCVCIHTCFGRCLVATLLIPRDDIVAIIEHHHHSFFRIHHFCREVCTHNPAHKCVGGQTTHDEHDSSGKDTRTHKHTDTLTQ